MFNKVRFAVLCVLFSPLFVLQYFFIGLAFISAAIVYATELGISKLDQFLPDADSTESLNSEAKPLKDVTLLELVTPDDDEEKTEEQFLVSR